MVIRKDFKLNFDQTKKPNKQPMFEALNFPSIYPYKESPNCPNAKLG